MKISLVSLVSILVFLSAFRSEAQLPSATISQNATWNLSTASQSFTFNRFAPSLGTLTAVDLIFNSASLSGSVTLQALSSTRTINGISTIISVTGAGIDSVASTADYNDIDITGNKLGIPTSGRTFTVNASQSAVEAPETLSLLDSAPDFTPFLGLGTFNFNSFLEVSPTGTPNNVNNLIVSGNTLASVANVTLLYTYTVPEPGQVAASLLLLSGIGTYVWIKRRKATRRATS